MAHGRKVIAEVGEDRVVRGAQRCAGATTVSSPPASSFLSGIISTDCPECFGIYQRIVGREKSWLHRNNKTCPLINFGRILYSLWF